LGLTQSYFRAHLSAAPLKRELRGLALED